MAERGHKDTVVCVLVPAGRGKLTIDIYLPKIFTFFLCSSVSIFFLSGILLTKNVKKSANLILKD